MQWRTEITSFAFEFMCVVSVDGPGVFRTSRPFSLPLSVARWQNEIAVIGIAQENNLSIFIVITAPVLNAHWLRTQCMHRTSGKKTAAQLV